MGVCCFTPCDTAPQCEFQFRGFPGSLGVKVNVVLVFDSFQNCKLTLRRRFGVKQRCVEQQQQQHTVEQQQ